MARVIFLFFFLSGFSSLVFEVLWERMLMQVFGSTTFAISTLLTAFMSGLALGSMLGGRLAARLRRPLLVYGLLEACIGLYGLVVPLLLSAMPSIYKLIFHEHLESFWLFSLLRFAAVFFVLLLPTTWMGATLPIVSHWIAQRAGHDEPFEGKIGLLYGMNTFGACAGCFVAGFVLLPSWGLARTNMTFVLVNVALGLLVFASARALERAAPPRHATHDRDASEHDAPEHDAPEREEQERDAAEHDLGAERDDEHEREALSGRVARAQAPPWLERAALLAFALSGMFSMSYQVLWTRAYVIVLGSSTYSFTVILVSFLVGLASGSALISAWIARVKRPLLWFALAQLGVCLAAVVAFFVLDRLPELLFDRLRQSIRSAHEIYLYNFSLVGLVVFAPTFLQGMSFPLMVRALIGQREGAAGAVGRLYAFNTGGSIAGSFLAGFALMPALGLSRAMTVIIGLNLLMACGLGALELWAMRDRLAARWLAPAALAVALIYALAPPIDRVRLTRGMFRVYWARELFDRDKLAKDAPKLLYYKDGVAVTTSVERRGRSVTLKGNGKAEASDGADMATQILVGLLPFVLRSGQDVALGQEQAVMVGYGSGVTAGGSLQWPLASLEVIEIEEAMIEASRFFDHVNHRPLQDPRTKLMISDGRNYLEYTDRRYDVIVSEPSNPWIAGVASLFTVEHFKRARRHLKPGGVFAQWVQLYEIRPENVRTIFASFAAAFDHVLVFSSMPKGTDLILIGSDQPLRLPADALARAWQLDSARRELGRAGLKDPHDLYGLLFMNRQEFLDFGRGAALNTDDNGRLEFEAPKDVIQYGAGERFFTHYYHEQERYGDIRPHLEGWPSAWRPEQVGELTRGVWRAGKLAMIDELLQDAGLTTIEDLPEPLAPPFDALEQTHLVRHAHRLPLDEAIAKLWPLPDSELAVTVRDAALHGKQTQAMSVLEGAQRPGKMGYPGERGLFYAYLLHSRGYHKLALRQLEGLRQRPEDASLVKSVVFALLEGHVLIKRLRYAHSWDAFARAGALLYDMTLAQTPPDDQPQDRADDASDAPTQGGDDFLEREDQID